MKPAGTRGNHADGGGTGELLGPASVQTRDRVWNALEKLCLLDPEIFAACQATSQVNVVNPGGGDGALSGACAEAARAIAFLASDESELMTGTTMGFDQSV